MKKYYTANKETGTFIEECDSYQEALEQIAEYERIDKEEGNYTEDYYDIEDENHNTLYE